MNTERQLNLWDIGTDKESFVLREVTDLKEKQNNLRRGLFQRYDMMQKEINALKEQIEKLRHERTSNHYLNLS